MPIDCTLSIRDESGHYYKNAYVTLLSIFENTNEKVRVHILHDDTIHYGKRSLEELSKQYGQEILFHRVPEFDSNTAEKITKWFNLGTMYRYFVHEFIESDKAIYLDCDIIVNRDIKDLFDVDLGNHLMGGVKDHSTYWDKKGLPRTKHKRKVAFFGWTESSYFNCGVILLNLYRIRKITETNNIFLESTLGALDAGFELNYPDQEIINSVCAKIEDGVLMLDASFNLWHGILGKSLAELQGTIVHYVSKTNEFLFPAHILFWKYYAKTPFAEDMFERMDKAYSSCGMDFVRFYLDNPKRRRQAEDFMNHGLLGMIGKGVKRALGRKR